MSVATYSEGGGEIPYAPQTPVEVDEAKSSGYGRAMNFFYLVVITPFILHIYSVVSLSANQGVHQLQHLGSASEGRPAGQYGILS